MQNITINQGWSILSDEKPNCLFDMPIKAQKITLPHDAMIAQGRSFSLANGQDNSYFPTTVTYFFRVLPKVANFQKVFLNIEGLCGECDIYIAGQFVKNIDGYEMQSIDVTNNYQSGAVLALRIATTSDTGAYVGNGIAGGVSLSIATDKFYIEPNGVSVFAKAEDTRATVDVTADVTNFDDAEKYAFMFVEVYNEKGKRITKKGKRIKLPLVGKNKSYDIKLRLSKAFEWTNFDPYTYSCSVSLIKEGANFDPGNACKVKFGIVNHSLVAKQYRLSNKLLKLKGVVVSHDNGIVGKASIPASEFRKLSALKDIGYNAVRYIGCPTQVALDTLDKLGLVCIVDIFDNLCQGEYSGDGHNRFDACYEKKIESSVKALRNHPCVAFYSVCNNADESYGRGRGYELVGDIVKTIKQFDSKKLLTANAFERVPLKSELDEMGIKFNFNSQDNLSNLSKSLVIAGREKDIFYKKTEPYFKHVDVAGYSYLYPRLAFDKTSRVLISLADSTEKVVDMFEEVDKNMGVVGGFGECGADYLGSAERDEKDYSSVKPCINIKGDLDFTHSKKGIAYYKEILLGKKNSSYMVVQDPDAYSIDDSENLLQTYPLWNWPRHVGQNVKVVVYTSGDIVALFQDGKQIGRKLAGKFNNHMAVFKVNFIQGKLEAVSFYKGVECSRCSLSTAMQPKTTKLDCKKKSIVAGEVTYIDITAVDKDGKIVSYASRDIDIEVSGEGEFVASGNGDPLNDRSTLSRTVSFHDGKAVVAVRGLSGGKIIVTISGDGIKTSKISIKVK